MNLDNRIKKWTNIAKLSAALSTIYGIVFLVFIQTKPAALVLVTLLVATLFFCDRATQLKEIKRTKNG